MAAKVAAEFGIAIDDLQCGGEGESGGRFNRRTMFDFAWWRPTSSLRPR